MQGAIYFKILIWGPSYSWLEWRKKPAGDNLPPKMFCTVFPLKKNLPILGDPGTDKGVEGKSKRAGKYIWNEEK